MIDKQTIKDVLVSIISDCAEYKPGTKEIYAKEGRGIKGPDRNVTVEILDDVGRFVMERGYFDNGKISWSCEYKNGICHGEEIDYDKSGNITTRIKWKKDKIIERSYDK